MWFASLNALFTATWTAHFAALSRARDRVPALQCSSLAEWALLLLTTSLSIAALALRLSESGGFDTHCLPRCAAAKPQDQRTQQPPAPTGPTRQSAHRCCTAPTPEVDFNSERRSKLRSRPGPEPGSSPRSPSGL